MNKILEVFYIFLRLGCTSFGGPIAHLSFFHDEFVSRRKWLTEESYADIVSLCQFLPGPASSQVGIVIGNLHAGFWGALIAWVGFTLPSAVLMILLAQGMKLLPALHNYNFLHSCKLIAVTVVAQALWQMGSKLCPDKERRTICIFSAIFILYTEIVFGQILVILLGGFIGYWLTSAEKGSNTYTESNATSVKKSFIYLFLFCIFLIFPPILLKFYTSDALILFASFYRVGSLVFGGGHVVLPLLKGEVIANHLISEEAFLSGYGLVQAMPGPLFTLTGFLGASSNLNLNGWSGGLFCLFATFLPSFLLVLGVLPFWNQFKEYKPMQRIMNGVNASVVGLLLAAFYNPIWTSAILSAKDFAFALFLFLLLAFWKFPSWSIVLASMAFSLFL